MSRKILYEPFATMKKVNNFKCENNKLKKSVQQTPDGLGSADSRSRAGTARLFSCKSPVFFLWQAAWKVGQPPFGQARRHRRVEDKFLLLEISQARVDGGQALAQPLSGLCG
jgi:hypothetical protein